MITTTALPTYVRSRREVTIMKDSFRMGLKSSTSRLSLSLAAGEFVRGSGFPPGPV